METIMETNNATVGGRKRGNARTSFTLLLNKELPYTLIHAQYSTTQKMATLRDASSSEDLLRLGRSSRAWLEDTGIVLKGQFPPSTPQVPICCGLPSSKTPTTPSVIPYEDILSVRPVDSQDGTPAGHAVSVTFAHRVEAHLEPMTLTITIDDRGEQDLVATIYERSYPNTQPRKRVVVLVNPHGGKGKGLDLFMERAKPILDAAEYEVDIIKTERNRHAIEIAQTIDIDKYDIIACASGDGIPYEVYNGLYRRQDRARALNKIAVTQLPCGSGNAMSNSCHGTNEASFAALSLVKSSVVNVDLMAVTQNGETTLSFLSQTFGVIADADIGTEYLRFLGPIRFDIGVAQGVLGRKTYPCDIAIKYLAKDKDDLRTYYDEQSRMVSDKNDSEITEANLALKYDADKPVPGDWEHVDREYAKSISVFYTGKMPVISPNVNFFPASLPNDGAIDLVMMNANTPLLKQLPILLSVDSGKHVDSPEVIHSKILAYRLIPRYGKGFLSIDGEEYPFEEYQVEVLANAGKTLAKNGMYVETGF